MKIKLDGLGVTLALLPEGDRAWRFWNDDSPDFGVRGRLYRDCPGRYYARCVGRYEGCDGMGGSASEALFDALMHVEEA